MRQYGEIRMSTDDSYGIRGIALDLLGLLGCVCTMTFLLFLAGGM